MKPWNLQFGGNWPVWLVLIIGLAAIGAAAWSYARRKDRKSRFGPWLTALRICALTAVALFLMKPILNVSRESSERGTVVVLEDASGSMSIRDAVGGVSRAEAVQQLISGAPYEFRKRIGKDYEVRTFAFGTGVEELKDGSKPKSEAAATALGDALARAATAVGAGRIAAIVLLSDGVRTVGEDPRAVAQRLGIPIYAVALGGRPEAKGSFVDVGIASAPRNQELIVKNQGTLKIGISSEGIGLLPEAQRTVSIVLKEGDKTLTDSVVELSPDKANQDVELTFVPESRGTKKLSVSVSELPGESLMINNKREFTVRVTEPHIRVLMVEGTARNEYRFLRRVLASDPDIAVAGVVKLRKDMFLLQDSESGADLSRGLPTKKDDFKKFDLVILGDVARAEFSNAQLALLRDFVFDGGGLILTGGRNAYGPGGYAGSAVAELSPFTITDKDGQTAANILPVLTPSGKEHPALTGCEEFFAAGTKAAALEGANLVAGVKSGATVLATSSGKDAIPILATQRYGSGVVMALTADTTWKWKFQMEGLGLQSPYYRFWRQTVRWACGRETLAPDIGETLTAQTDKDQYDPGEMVKFEAAVRDEKGEPVENADVKVEIAAPGMDSSKPGPALALIHQPLGLGAYSAATVARSEGVYAGHVTAEVNGKEIGRKDIEFSVGAAAGEFDRVDVDEPLLRAISSDSGGEFHTMATASHIPEQLAQRRKRFMVREEKPLFDGPVFFLTFMGLVSAEWFLRRRAGLS